MLLKPWTLWILLTIVVWGVAGLLRKPASQYLSPSGAVVAELMGGALALVVLGYLFQEKIFSKPSLGTLYALIIGFLAAGGTLFVYKALKTGPLSIVSALAALSVLIPVVFGIFIFHEQVTWVQRAGISFALLAAVLLSL